MEEQAAPVTVERIGPRRYTARNNRGGQVEIGGPEVEGVFRPGELLAVALGACNAMTADIPIGRRLGEDFEASVTVRPTKDTEENRYTRAEVEMVLGAAAADRLDEITKVAGRAIEKGCTVGRTLQAGMSDSLSIHSRDDANPAQQAAGPSPNSADGDD